MRIRSFFVVALSLGLLAGCKYETFADPTLSQRDVELLALAPTGTLKDDTLRGRYRLDDTTGELPGTIVVESGSRFLNYVEEGGTMLRYNISVGQDAYRWSGEATVGRKEEWPGWIPGEEARKLNPALPLNVPGGPLNPLGSRGMYLFQGNTDTQIRIHGTNQPDSIGRAVSLGCIRMRNIDVIDLYSRVKIGAKVIIK